MVDGSSKIVRIYPSVSVRYEDGTTTTISLQWYEENRAHVDLLSYTLILIYENGMKEEIQFPNEDEMYAYVTTLYEKLRLKK